MHKNKNKKAIAEKINVSDVDDNYKISRAHFKRKFSLIGFIYIEMYILININFKRCNNFFFQLEKTFKGIQNVINR